MEEVQVVAGIIYFDNKILCMQKGNVNKEYMNFKFEFPGGKIENGESKIDALKRELREELDLEVDVNENDYFMTNEHFYKPERKIILNAYKCRALTKEFTMKEHLSFKWCDIDELSNLDFAAADIPIRNKLVENK